MAIVDANSDMSGSGALLVLGCLLQIGSQSNLATETTTLELYTQAKDVLHNLNFQFCQTGSSSIVGLLNIFAI